MNICFCIWWFWLLLNVSQLLWWNCKHVLRHIKLFLLRLFCWMWHSLKSYRSIHHWPHRSILHLLSVLRYLPTFLVTHFLLYLLLLLESSILGISCRNYHLYPVQFPESEHLLNFQNHQKYQRTYNSIYYQTARNNQMKDRT